MSDQPANITLKLALDQAAINESKQGIDVVSKQIRDFKTSVQDAGQAADKSISDTGQAFGGISSDAADATKEVQKLSSALEATSQSAAKLGQSGGVGLNSLRRTGGALTQLGLGDIGQPLAQIGALGQVTKTLGAISESTSLGIETTTVAFAGLEVTLSPLLLVLAAVALAVLDLKLILDSIKKSTDDAVTAQKAKFDQDQAAAEQAKKNRDAGRTESTEQNQQFVNDTYGDAADLQKRINDKKAEIAKNQADYDALGSSFNPLERNKLSGVRGELDKELNTLMQQQIDTFGQSENAAKNIQPQIDKTEGLKKAQDDLLKSSDDLIKTRQQEQQDLNLTSKAANEKLAALKSDAEATTEARDKLIKSGDTSKEVTDKIAAYNDALKQNADEQKYLTDTATPLIKAREDEAQKIKDTTKALADQAKAGDDYEKAVTAENVARQKNIDAIQHIEDTANQDRADLEQSYADKRVDIARKAVDDAKDALTKLNETYADAFDSADRDLQKNSREDKSKLIDDQIKFNQQEVADKTDHLQKLQDIQRNAQQADQDALLNRNFRQLFQNKQATSNAIDSENERYQRQEQQRIVALKNEESDQARASARQRQERLIAYGYALDDADKQYQRTLDQQQTKEQREFRDAQTANQRSESALTTKVNRELAIQEAAGKAQVALTEQTEALKLEVLRNAQAATAAVMGGASAAAHGTGSSRPVLMAAGGRLSAFQAAIVNEPGSSGNEGFNGVKFPPGQGLFIPSRSGNVDSGRGGGNGAQIGAVNIHIHEANNPQATEAAVYRALKKVVA